MKTIDTLVPKELIPYDPHVDQNVRRSILEDSGKNAAEYVKSYDVGRGGE